MKTFIHSPWHDDMWESDSYIWQFSKNELLNYSLVDDKRQMIYYTNKVSICPYGYLTCGENVCDLILKYFVWRLILKHCIWYFNTKHQVEKSEIIRLTPSYEIMCQMRCFEIRRQTRYFNILLRLTGTSITRCQAQFSVTRPRTCIISHIV